MGRILRPDGFFLERCECLKFIKGELLCSLVREDQRDLRLCLTPSNASKAFSKGIDMTSFPSNIILDLKLSPFFFFFPVLLNFISRKNYIMSVRVWKFFKKEITNLREIIGNPLLCKHEHINTL